MISSEAGLAPALAGEPGAGGPFDGIDFVVVDVETTGWSPREAQITDLAAVRVRGGQVLGQFCSLVNPGQAIPGHVTELTGISDAMVAAAPPRDRVLAGFLQFAQGCVLTAHNAPFDVSFLAAACVASGLDWPDFTVVDTVTLARRVLGASEVPDRKLATLADFFGTATRPSHRALADALATAEVLLALLPRATAAGLTMLAELSAPLPPPSRLARLWRAAPRMLRAITRWGRARRAVRYRR